MLDLQNENNYNSFLQRIDRLRANTPSQWGTMDVPQMFAHCADALEASLGMLKLNRSILSFLFGSFMKSTTTSQIPFKKNLPTHEKLIMNSPREFSVEKQRLLNLIDQFYNANLQDVAKNIHAFYGKLTPEQWNSLMGKHLDHHLQQFGV